MNLAKEEEGKIQERLSKRKEVKEIARWVSTAEVEHDHIQVGETLGSHYQESGQWFQRIVDSWLTFSDERMLWLTGSGSYLKPLEHHRLITDTKSTVGTGKSSLVYVLSKTFHLWKTDQNAIGSLPLSGITKTFNPEKWSGSFFSIALESKVL